MEFYEIVEYINTFWYYLSYFFYAYICLTFFPKFFRNIYSAAKAQCDRNQYSFHRCYGPEHCCHLQNFVTNNNTSNSNINKPKIRKAVTRVRRHLNNSERLETSSGGVNMVSNVIIKRQVPTADIQTHTHVNEIAQMFEKGTHRTVNPVKVINLQLGGLQRTSIELNNKDGDDVVYKPLINCSNQISSNLTNQQILENLNLINNQTLISSAESSSPHSSPLSSTQSSPLSSPHSSPPLSPTLLSNSSNLILNNDVGKTSLPFYLNPSLENIFDQIARSAESGENIRYSYNGCKTLSPVNSIEDILAQRRLSRTLSAYSISDLLDESAPTPPCNGVLDDEKYKNFLNTRNPS